MLVIFFHYSLFNLVHEPCVGQLNIAFLKHIILGCLTQLSCCLLNNFSSVTSCNLIFFIIILHILFQFLGFEIGELDSVLELLEFFPYRLVFQTGSIFVMENLNELLCSFKFVA